MFIFRFVVHADATFHVSTSTHVTFCDEPGVKISNSGRQTQRDQIQAVVQSTVSKLFIQLEVATLKSDRLFDASFFLFLVYKLHLFIYY